MIEQKEREFEDLVLWVVNVNARIEFIMSNNARISGDESFHALSFKNVSYDAIICSFMTLLDSKCLEKDLHITGLTLLRKIVEVENKEEVSPSADWVTDWQSDYAPIIESKQNELVKIGCIQFLCKHIQEIDDDEILEQAFLVCITLLLGGNIQSQDAFYQYFMKQDPYNIFFLKLKSMLIEQFDLTKKFISQKNAKLAMIYKMEQRKLQSDKAQVRQRELAKADDEPNVPQKKEGSKFSFFRKKSVNDVESPKEEQKDEEGENMEEEGSDREEGLLTFDQSNIDENEQNPGGDAAVDEMFLVNQIKAQYI